ncbi:hypothetical protein N9D84_02235, partial [Planktomarina temperata]|nr:hypothetical protein [Planktomarina temperata]
MKTFYIASLINRVLSLLVPLIVWPMVTEQNDQALSQWFVFNSVLLVSIGFDFGLIEEVNLIFSRFRLMLLRSKLYIVLCTYLYIIYMVIISLPLIILYYFDILEIIWLLLPMGIIIEVLAQLLTVQSSHFDKTIIYAFKIMCANLLYLALTALLVNITSVEHVVFAFIISLFIKNIFIILSNYSFLHSFRILQNKRKIITNLLLTHIVKFSNIFVAKLFSTFTRQGDNIVLISFLEPIYIVQYNITVKIFQLAQIVTGELTNTIIRYQKKLKTCASFNKIKVWFLMVTGLMFLCVVTLNSTFISLWIGGEYYLGLNFSLSLACYFWVQINSN